MDAAGDDRGDLEKVLAGDRAAYAAIVARHGDRVYRLALAVLGNAAAAEDCAQEAFLRAYERLPSFRGAARFSTWLHRIALNEALQALRRRRRSRTIPMSDLSAADQARARNSPAPGSGEAAVEALDLLRTLPPNLRAALFLREVEGRTYDEIASAMGRSSGTIASWIHRARERLRERLRRVERS